MQGKRKRGRPKCRVTDVVKVDMSEVEVTEEDTEDRNNRQSAADRIHYKSILTVLSYTVHHMEQPKSFQQTPKLAL